MRYWPMLVLTLYSAQGFAQNLLNNTGFDQDLSAWEQPFGGATWAAIDEFDALDSGSLYLTDGGEFGLPFTQCISPSPAASIELSLSYRVPPEVTFLLNNAIGFFLIWHDLPDCSGGSIASDNLFEPMTVQGAWTRLKGSVAPPIGAQSLTVQILLLGSGSSDFAANIDNVFAGDRPIFIDGFEAF